MWAARALTALLCTVNAGRGLPRDRSAYVDGARDTLKNVVAYVALTSKRLDMLCRDRRPHAQQCKNCAFAQAFSSLVLFVLPSISFIFWFLYSSRTQSAY